MRAARTVPSQPEAQCLTPGAEARPLEEPATGICGPRSWLYAYRM